MATDADDFEFEDVPSPVRLPQELWDKLAAIALLKGDELSKRVGRKRTVSRNTVIKNALRSWVAEYEAANGDVLEALARLGLSLDSKKASQ